MEYAEDVDSAVDTLTRGAEFAEAYRIVSCVSQFDARNRKQADNRGIEI